MSAPSHSFGTYLVGSGWLLGILAAAGLGGHWLRRLLVPAYEGALARLAALVLAPALLVLSLELVGSFGGLRPEWMLVGCAVPAAVATGLGLRFAPRASARGTEAPPPRQRAPRVEPWALAVALVVAAVAVAQWSMPSLLNLDRGMFGGDTTWYHLPFAIHFAQSGSTWGLLYTDPLKLTAWFYPASSELLGAVGIVLFHDDWLYPLLNLGWLCLGLLAGWCLGRPRGVGPACTVAAAIALDSGVLILTQAGEARNDEMGIALLLATAALLYNGYRDGGWGALALAGVAGGLAASVKLTMLAPVGAMAAVALVAIAARRRRGGPLGALALLSAGALAGGYWYLRNLAHAGNPVPEVHGIGPLELPYPHQMDLYPRPPRSVADYLGDAHVLGAWFVPGLHEALGPLWPGVLALALAGAVWAVVGSREPILAAIGAAAILTAVVYLFTPLTAAGPPGEPAGFFTNTRYLLPGVALGLVLLPLAGPLRRNRVTRGATLAGLAAVFAVGAVTGPGWEARFLWGAALCVVALVLAPALAAIFRRAPGLASRPRLRGALLAALALALLLPALALGHGAENRYLRRHYSLATLRVGEPGLPVRTFAWAHDQRDRRIGIAGAGELFFDQAILAGDEDSNIVRYVGRPLPHGGYRVAPSCADFRRLVDRGRFDFLVITEFGDNAPGRRRYPLREWVEGDPALELIRTEKAFPQTAYTYRVRGRLDPGGCPGRGRSA
ncbi:MAG: hypothetical protein JSU06_20085 [Actinobacteria bacterium]|nr:hypothetical protein [Actinomycetota bacterium]